MNTEQSDLVDEEVYRSIDGSWIGLLVLSIFISVTSIIAMIALFMFWRRYQRELRTTANQSFSLSQQPTGKRPVPVPFDNKSYETQQLDVYVPPNENDRAYPRFSEPEDIQRIQEFYERTTKAYF